MFSIFYIVLNYFKSLQVFLIWFVQFTPNCYKFLNLIYDSKENIVQEFKKKQLNEYISLLNGTKKIVSLTIDCHVCS